MNTFLILLAFALILLEVSFIPQINANFSNFPLIFIFAIIIMQKYNPEKGLIWLIISSIILGFFHNIPYAHTINYIVLGIISIIAIKLIFAKRSIFAFNGLLIVNIALITVLDLFYEIYNINFLSILMMLILANLLYLNTPDAKFTLNS